MKNLLYPDLNTLLMIANGVVGLCGLSVYQLYGANEYVDAFTFGLLEAACLQNIAILFIERRRRDPFIIVLMAIIVPFYVVRVLTLCYDPWSLALTAGGCDVRDVNESLIIVLLGNFAIVAGIIYGRTRRELFLADDQHSTAFRRPATCVTTLGLCLLLTFVPFSRIPLVGTLLQYFATVALNPYFILLIGALYIGMRKIMLTRLEKALLGGFFAAFVVVGSILGSRSAVLSILITFLVGILVLDLRIRIKFRWLLLIVLAIPVSVYLFKAATYVRQLGYDTTTVAARDRYTKFSEYNALGEQDLQQAMRPILDRMGYLDYATALIANRSNASAVINIEYYFKSVIDNILTPGFDLFDTPRASHVLRFHLGGSGEYATHADVLDDYNSAMFSAYAEAFVLCGGYGGLLLLFGCAYAFRRIYSLLSDQDSFFHHIKKAFCLLLFLRWIDSFGLDWIVIDLVGMAATVIVFRICLLGQLWSQATDAAKRLRSTGNSYPVPGRKSLGSV